MNLCTHIVTGHKRQRSEDSNSDERHSFRKHKDFSKGSDSSLNSTNSDQHINKGNIYGVYF